MPEDISVKILTQTNDNIQQLFNLSSRIDEKVKAIKEQQDTLEEKLSEVMRDYTEMTKKVAVLESHSGEGVSGLVDKIENQEKAIVELDKRMIGVEALTNSSQNRWKGIVGFMVQLVWIIIAAYAITTLGLTPPPLP
jgi:chromosome segregation ATPase